MPSPASGAGFALGQDLAAAETRCTGAGFAWQKLDDARSSCRGAPIDLDAPATVKLAACEGAVCEVVVHIGAEGAPWSELVPLFPKLIQRLNAAHGDQHESTNEPVDCPPEVQSCFAAGLARKSATWRWANKQSVSLMLDGGPHGSAPSLVIVYGTRALLARKP